MDADRINAQVESGNPAEANAPQSRRMAKMLRALEFCFAENIRAELFESYNYADEESMSATMRREYNLSDAILDHFYEAAQQIGAIERTPRADGITLSAVTDYQPISRPVSREANAASERGDYPAAHGTQRRNGNPVLLFPDSTRPANLCHDPQPTIRAVEHTDKSKQRKDEVDIWREDHSQHRRANLRSIARTADWSRQPTDYNADPLAAIREKMEAQIQSGQARKNAARAENTRRKRKLDERKLDERKASAESERDLPREDDGYVIPGCGAAADDDDDQQEQEFIPSVLDGMAAASYTEVWDS